MAKNYQSHEPCVVCDEDFADRCYHHLYGRKAYPKLADFDWNKISVCQGDHNDFHTEGTRDMADEYPSVKAWLIAKGWEFDSYAQKWFHPQAAIEARYA